MIFLPEDRLALWLKVSNLLVFKEDRLGVIRLGLHCISVKKRLALFHRPRSPVYII